MAKLEKEEARQREESERLKQKQMKNRPKRAPFDFEQEKPKVLGSIVEASQASSNLVNAITLVNPEKESLQSSERVQECLGKTKLARKQIVRYIQLVENEEVIGVLIETNDRIIAALEMYDSMSTDPKSKSDETTSAIAAGMASAHISTESEVNKLQEKQKAAVQKAKLNGSIRNGSTGVYADLEDLSFGTLGESSNNLPQPIRPTSMSGESAGAEARGSLSDFSDYESSDEETHNTRATSSKNNGKDHYYSSSDEGGRVSGSATTNHLSAADDPFADPFAD